MFNGNAVLTATIKTPEGEKDYKRQFSKLFPVSLADLFSKEFSGNEIALNAEQEAVLAAFDSAFPSPTNKEALKATKVTDNGTELSQHEIGSVIEYYVNPALRPAFHAINAKFDVDQRSQARQDLEKELGVAKPKKTVRIDDAVSALAETLFSFNAGPTLEACIAMAKTKLKVA